MIIINAIIIKTAIVCTSCSQCKFQKLLKSLHDGSTLIMNSDAEKSGQVIRRIMLKILQQR